MARSRRNNDDQKVKLTKQNLSEALSVFRYIRPHRGYFILGMVLLVLGSVIFMALMGLPGEMVKVASGEKPSFDIGKNITVNDFGWMFLVLLLAQGLLSYFRVICFTIVSEKGMADLRTDLYEKIISQPISFFEKRRVGELTSRITTDVEQLQSVFSVTLAEFLRQVVTLIVGISVLAYLTPRLSIIMLITIPGIVVVAMIFGRYIRKLSKKRQDHLAEANTIVEETFQSFSIVKAFANEWYESIRYGKSVSEIVKISIDFAKVRGLFFGFILTFLLGGIFFILWRGALMVQDGTLEAGDLFTFIIFTGVIGGAIASFGSLYTSIASAVGATERIQEILKEDNEIDIQAEEDVQPLDIKGDIRYDHVAFSYPTRKDVEVLKDISFEVKSGSKIALVGQSGSGKSTIVQLLMKFYNVDSGTIYIDGKDIRDYELISLRKNLGVVPQEVILFGGTIRENILYGKPHATETELYAAAEKSNSLEFIEGFPDGFNTIVGDRGIKLSGGQRQRIAIARAILKDPDILILDEATSSLDAESERLVQDALNKLMEGRTSIIIAHRLATIRDVDRIYVIEKGHIIESGTHDELTAIEDGAYNSLAKLQFEEA